MASVLVTGATGFIGPKLVRRLREQGDRVSAYVRDAAKARAVLGPDVELVTDLAALPSGESVDAIVNLAGASIAGGLWTARRRRVLLESRLGVTRALLELCARLERKPETWINASAIGYYGARASDEPVDESADAGTGFQAQRTLNGALNASSPEPVRAKAFMRALAGTLRRPLWPIRIPAPLVRGELAELFVDGQRVVPTRALALGFRFAHPDVVNALEQLLRPPANVTRRG